VASILSRRVGLPGLMWVLDNTALAHWAAWSFVLVTFDGAVGSGRAASQRSRRNARSLTVSVPNSAAPKMIIRVIAWATKRLRPSSGCRQLVTTGTPTAPTPIPSERHGAWKWLSCDADSHFSAGRPVMLITHSDHGFLVHYMPGSRSGREAKWRKASLLAIICFYMQSVNAGKLLQGC
jgi:hypothetical protein